MVRLLFLISNDVDMLQESGVLKNDIIRLFIEFKKLLTEQNEKILGCKRNEEVSFIEIIPNK